MVAALRRWYDDAVFLSGVVSLAGVMLWFLLLELSLTDPWAAALLHRLTG